MGFSLSKAIKSVASIATGGLIGGPKIKDPSKAAAAAEAERQAGIDRQVGAINTAFDNPQRESDIQGFLGSARKFYLDDLNEQKRKNDLQTTFALARTGLSGGSRDVDLRRAQGKSYLKGVLTADQRAQGAAAALRTADRSARQNLINLATTGASVGNAGQQALQSLQSNIASQRGELAQNTLGNIFSDFADVYTTSREAAGRRRASKYGITGYGSEAYS